MKVNILRICHKILKLLDNILLLVKMKQIITEIIYSYKICKFYYYLHSRYNNDRNQCRKLYQVHISILSNIIRGVV